MQPPPPPAIFVHQSPPQYKTRDFRHDHFCVTLEKYCPSSKTKLKTDKKSLSSTLKFKTRPDAKSVFKCEGKTFSLKDKKILIDVETKQTILTITKELLTLAEIYKIWGPVSSKFLWKNKPCKKYNSFFLLQEHHEICKLSVERTALKAKLTTTFTTEKNGRKKEYSILVKANLDRKRCCVYLVEDSLMVLATMERVVAKVNPGQLLLGDEEYEIEIEPGVDVPFILGLCVAVLEENSSM